VSVAPPTVRQVYALAAALCERSGEEFPATREVASDAIERLRAENGHPAPAFKTWPSAIAVLSGPGAGRGSSHAIAAEVARELK
jgi:hypothetical protein